MNIKEVARQAGVSVATVSRVLNHPELVQPETRGRVLSVMEQLNYTPNWFARGLNLGKTRTIALLVPNIERDTYQHIFSGVETVALKKGYATFLCNTRQEREVEADCLRMVLDRRVDGVLISAPLSDPRLLSSLGGAGIPYVGVGRLDAGGGESCCYINWEEGAFRMAGHLLGLGHRRLGLLLDRAEPEDARGISAGFRRAVLAHGDGADGRVLPAEESVQGGLVAARKLFQLGGLPDALLCGSDAMAFGVLKAARERGLSIPEDLGLACLTDSPLCSILTPALTALELPAARLGMVAARMLFDLIENEELSEAVPQEIILQPKLKIRRSCGNRAHISELYD